MTFRVTRVLSALTLALFVGSCSDRGVMRPTLPPIPSPPPPLSGLPLTRSVSGTVWLHSASGVEPARDGGIYGWLLGANIPSFFSNQGPTLSGVVYEETAGGRRPVPNAWMALDGFMGMGVIIATTRTDDRGRYFFCAVPPIAELAVVGSADGFSVIEAYNIVGKTTVDIEARR